jgi:hypothetical protein
MNPLEIAVESLGLFSWAAHVQVDSVEEVFGSGHCKMPHISPEHDLKRFVTPNTISAVISKLREAADETMALAANLNHAASIADLEATARSLLRDIDELEKISASWQARASPAHPNRGRARMHSL